MKNLISNINEVIPYTYEKIKSKHFEELFKKALLGKPSSNTPRFVHMLGIPSAGKSTFYDKNKDKFKNFVFISFDDLMTSHPGYQQDLKNLESVKTFNKWELPARIAGYELLRRAVQQQKNIFFDHGGSPNCHQELLINIKALGYKTEMYYIYCSIEEAIKRSKDRELITKRHTPEQMIKDRFYLIESKKDTYKQITDVFVEI